ncbi:MAG: hypothetical protein C5B59_12795 [Bacteroidetes bacterium]|nr:MAG: hypothetical protein C5B59_12795 [Bacteroidota bacterium]
MKIFHDKSSFQLAVTVVTALIAIASAVFAAANYFVANKLYPVEGLINRVQAEADSNSQRITTDEKLIPSFQSSLEDIKNLQGDVAEIKRTTAQTNQNVLELLAHPSGFDKHGN